jgi:hypothetical protein
MASPSRRDARVAEHLVMDRERDADGAARVAGRGLDPEPLERPFAQQAAVADAVERDAARETEVLLPGLACTCRAMRSMISSVTTCTTPRGPSPLRHGDSACAAARRRARRTRRSSW